MVRNLLDKSKHFLEENETFLPVQIISSKHELQKNVYHGSEEIKNKKPTYKWNIVWRNVAIFIVLHFFAFQGLYYLFVSSQWKTFFWVYALLYIGGQGITSGAHRLWAHRAYKAKLPLRILLCFLQTMALQNDIYEWVRDHRVHHKFTDTNADPHNASRGFFFSHMGWLLVKKHQDVFTKGKTVDVSDLLEDPVVRFQMRFYVVLAPICCFAIPVAVPWYFWNENIYVSWCFAGVFRYIFSLHSTWLVNSAAHFWGNKPYEKDIKPCENKTVAFFTLGEGWHNYHHVYPWDYKAAELGNYRWNFSTAFIDFMAKIGWAYDLKSVSVDLIKKRATRTGDGTRKNIGFSEENELKDDDNYHNHDNTIWEWDDKDLNENDKLLAKIEHSKIM